MASTCCCSGGPDRGYSLSPGISRPSMRTDTTPQPPYSAVSWATTGPPGRVKKVSRICPPDSAGQLNAPPGNLVRPLTTAAILATMGGSVPFDAAWPPPGCKPRISVVDRGSAVDLGVQDAPDQPHNPNPPRYPADPMPQVTHEPHESPATRRLLARESALGV